MVLVKYKIVEVSENNCDIYQGSFEKLSKEDLSVRLLLTLKYLYVLFSLGTSYSKNT